MTTLTPLEERYRMAVTDMVAAMPEELRAECAALAELSPEDAGVRTHYDETGDGFEVTWVGRPLGWISRHWLVTGEER